MEGFDPLAYWEDRHNTTSGLDGVGYLHLNGYNEWMYRVKRRVFQRVLRPYADQLRGARVLDVGSGTGFYLEQWRRHPIGELMGSDFSEVALGRMREQLPSISIVKLDITTDDRSELERLGRFDFVSMMDVVYHVVDDALYDRVFRNIASLLKPGGRLVFTENFLQSAPRRGNAWQILRERGEIEASLAQAGLRMNLRAPWFVLMNDPVDSSNRLWKRGWFELRKLCGRSRLSGFAIGAAMYPAEILLTKAFAESPTTEIAIAERI